MVNCFREGTLFEKIVIKLRVQTWYQSQLAARASQFKIPKTLRKGGIIPFFRRIRDHNFLIIILRMQLLFAQKLKTLV